MSASESFGLTRPEASATPAPPTPWQSRLVWTCWLLGGLGRLIYLFVIHPATQHVYSDMQGYYERALRFANGGPESIADTLYPPGMSMMLGLLYRLDTSWVLSIIGQWLLSLAVMGLIWLIARRVYGTAVAVIALLIATLHFPFTHYAALWLAENPFTVLVLATVWWLLGAVQVTPRAHALACALLGGLAAGLAIAFKNTILGSLAVIGFVGLLYVLRHRHWRLLPLALATIAGLTFVLALLSARCTRLDEGRFCLSANNLGMNVLMGHYGPVREFRWVDPARQITMTFTAVESALRAYDGQQQLDFGAYDSARNLALAKAWIAEHPRQALALSLRNVWSLFAAKTLWPAAQYRGIDYGLWSQRFFWWLILPPALLTLARRAPVLLRLQAGTLPEWLLLAPLLGLMVSVFVSITEVRFRVPFDGLIIVLAAQGWCIMYSSLRHVWGKRFVPNAELSTRLP